MEFCDILCSETLRETLFLKSMENYHTYVFHISIRILSTRPYGYRALKVEISESHVLYIYKTLARAFSVSKRKRVQFARA